LVDNIALAAGVELTVKFATPLVALELRFTVGSPRQVGRFIAPVGDEASAQERVIVPAQPLVELTVTVEVPDDPAATIVDVAVMEYTGFVTVTDPLPIAPR
jgi:hypothetical protein